MLIKREITKKLQGHLSYPEISLLIGPRQVGKTTTILGLKKELELKGKKTIYLDFDKEDDFAHASSQSKLVRYLNFRLGEGKSYVFIDEVQRKENAGLFLKGIYDLRLPYKFILSGSGSLELKEKIAESLAGRKRVFVMEPVNFREFVNFQTNYKYTKNLGEFFELEGKKSFDLLQDYLNFGGYPEVVLARTIEDKLLVISEIYESYLDKDIKDLLKVQKVEEFSKLLTLLADQVGKLVNITEIANTLSIDHETVKKYLWYLEKTFILKICRPFFKNPRSELTKTPTYYFFDLGMRNYAYNRFARFDLFLQGGFLFENLIRNLLGQIPSVLSSKVNYWRSKDGAEVDFILSAGVEAIPIEVKYKKLKKPMLTRSFRSYITRYKPRKAYVVNLSLRDSRKIGETTVEFIPYYKLMFDNVFGGL